MISLNTNDAYTEDTIIKQQEKGGSIVERLKKQKEQREKITATIFNNCGETLVILYKYGKNKYERLIIRNIKDDININIDFRYSTVKINKGKETLTYYPFKYSRNEFKPKSKKALENALDMLKPKVNAEIFELFNDKFFYELSFFMVDNYEKFENSIKGFSTLYELKEKPKNSSLLMDFSEIIEEDLDIKKTEQDNGECRFYYLNNNSYEILTVNRLGVLIDEHYKLRLPPNSIKEALISIPRLSIEQDYYWEFEKHYLDTRDYTVKPHDKAIITPKKASRTIARKIVKFRYLPNVEYLSEKPTLVEKTLRQILIPKYNPEDTRLYMDFIQRLGASRIPNNKHKKITEYNGDGDDGKSTITYLMKLIYGDYFIGTTADSMSKDMFNASYIGNKHIIIIDEIMPNSLNGVWDTLKRISSGVNNTSVRGAYDKDPTKNINYGMMFIMSNVTPNLTYVDKATLNRYDILKMPNKFVENPTKDNEYASDSKIFEKLKNDFNGLEWLVNASIKAYMECNGKFKCNQTAEETLNIFQNGDDVTRFLTTCTRISTNTRTTASELADSFITFANEEEIDLEQRYKTCKDLKLAISREIGSKLTSIYDPKDLYKDTNKDRKVDYNIELTKYK